MTRDNPFTAFFSNEQINTAMQKYQCSALDMGKFLEINRKNLLALSRAQQQGLQNAQDLTNKQMEIISEFLKEQSSATNDILCEGKPEEKIIKNSERMQKSYKKAMSNLEEIAAIIKEANSKTTRILNDQAKENIKTISEKAEENTKAASA